MGTLGTKPRAAWAMIAAATVAAALASADPAAAQPDIFPTIAWTVQPSFGTPTEGRTNVSGATCMTVPPGVSCVAVNDGARFAQLFAASPSDRSIRPKQVVAYSPDQAVPARNAEGAGHDGTFFYAVTSRGRQQSGQDDLSFLVMRFTEAAAGRPVIPGPGDPQFPQRFWVQEGDNIPPTGSHGDG